MTTNMYDVGVIHGRFQVLHNDHLRYLLAGAQRCKHLVVGVTNPDPSLTRPEKSDSKRDAPSANPLTYYERQHMLRQALIEAGLEWEEFSVVPLPINFPKLYRHYVPLDAVFFLTIYDAWGRAKHQRFLNLGLRVEILWERSPEQKGISGNTVRKVIRQGGVWRSLVPPSVARLVEQWNIQERLKELEEAEEDVEGRGAEGISGGNSF